MSMLSAQCDELRAMAESVGLEVPQAATLMMDAADTILSLRDRAQDLQAENAKLRELVRDMWRGSVTRMDFADRYAFIGEFVDRMRELGVDA